MLSAEGLLAPLVLDRPINGDAFVAWVKQFLMPEQRPGDFVVLDNLSSHMASGVKETIEGGGAALRYLPPYSPDFNPIVQIFFKHKGLLYKTQARTLEAARERHRFITRTVQLQGMRALPSPFRPFRLLPVRVIRSSPRLFVSSCKVFAVKLEYEHQYRYDLNSAGCGYALTVVLKTRISQAAFLHAAK